MIIAKRERERECLIKSCKKTDLGMAAVGNLRALFLDSRGRIKLLLLFRHPDAAFVFFLFFSVDFNRKRRKKRKNKW